MLAPSGGHEPVGIRVVEDPEPGIHQVRWRGEGADEARHSLLAVHYPVRVGRLGRVDLQRPDAETCGGGRPLPHEQGADGIAAHDAVEQPDDVVPVPAEGALEGRNAQPSVAHQAREVRETDLLDP